MARGFGDLSENAEYDDAKNEQSRLEAQIMELENTLRTAIVIDESNISTDRVNIGTTVRILDIGLKEEEEFTIVGARESDPDSNKISNESPLGAALLGKTGHVEDHRRLAVEMGGHAEDGADRQDARAADAGNGDIVGTVADPHDIGVGNT